MSNIDLVLDADERLKRQIKAADIIVATHAGVGVEFVIFGKGKENSSNPFNPTLVVQRVPVHGPNDVSRLCELVEQVKGFHEFETFSDRRRAF